MTSHRVPPRHPAMPPIPQDGDGPVFREPWEAQAFALVLELFDTRPFHLEGVGPSTLSAEIAAARERGEPDLGGTLLPPLAGRAGKDRRPPND